MNIPNPLQGLREVDRRLPDFPGGVPVRLRNGEFWSLAVPSVVSALLRQAAGGSRHAG